MITYYMITYYMIFSDIFALFLAQNFKPKVLTTQKNLLLECLLPTRPLTVQSFTALAVLFNDCKKLTYVKQHNVALSFKLL